MKKEILVFESDECGYHSTPIGKLAKEMYGAEEMFGVGLHGNSYAIPTLDMFGNKLSIREINIYIEKFIDFAIHNPRKSFILSKIGTEKYGMSAQDSDKLFGGHVFPSNVKMYTEDCSKSGIQRKIRGYVGLRNMAIQHRETETVDFFNELISQLETKLE